MLSLILSIIKKDGVIRWVFTMICSTVFARYVVIESSGMFLI